MSPYHRKEVEQNTKLPAAVAEEETKVDEDGEPSNDEEDDD